ncbi:uncharacterized protein LOC122392555 [Amphibalanus amphitrite]|uniref:uncharacterized protein LOC122392555 n=1 Tax=Amphibalanus amphitrite TaxID=1232801 RepID=UPI001C91229B|nr:uncharacterized protein LOC122392555 [Amphibalanus amphitrite]
MFAVTGVPVVLRTDGGPQFASSTLRRFLERWGVRHEMSSPRYPRSNGHAEAAVKTVKKLVVAASSSGRLDDEQLDRGLLELRNAPRADGRSPAQRAADECDEKAAEVAEDVRDRHDSRARPLSSLRIGCKVDIQNTDTRRWDRTGVIVGIGRRRSYLVKLPSGRIWWRNRRFLRPLRSMLVSTGPSSPRLAGPAQPVSHERLIIPSELEVTPASPPPSPPMTSPPLPILRRSGRDRRPPSRLTVRWGGCSYE